MKKALAGLGCIGLLFLGFVGCVALVAAPDTQTKATDSSVQQGSVQTESKTIPLAAKTNIRTDRALTVNSLELVDQLSVNNGFTQPLEAKGGKIAIVRMTLENTGNESGNSVFTSAKLIDSQGRSYDQIQDFEEAGTIYLWEDAEGLDSINDQLFPGGIAEIAKVFRVAPDASGFTVVVNNLNFATE